MVNYELVITSSTPVMSITMIPVISITGVEPVTSSTPVTSKYEPVISTLHQLSWLNMFYTSY